MARRAVPPDEGRAAVLAAGDAWKRGVAPDRTVLRAAVKHTLQLLVDRAPGHAVEIRVPPFAAVQAVAGPTHRRGTPAAVVEMDAPTWLAVATGTLSWDRARSEGRIRASGERADLSPWLPLVRS